jgi:protein-disulfide isomerase
MASETEKIFSSNEPETAFDEVDLSLLPLDQGHPRPWRYFGIGLGIILLSAALGGVILSYLARPTVDLALWGPIPIFSPTQGPTVKEASVQFIPVRALTPTISSQAASSAPASPTSTRVIQETPIQSEPVKEPPPTITPQANSVAPASPTPTIMDFVLSDARHFQGDSSAPVTLVEFSDLKCYYCSRFSTETLPQLRQIYVDTGQVRLVYKHFSILGLESDVAAAATECAAEQDRFWEYHDQIFADQVVTRSILTPEQLISLAEKIGLSISAFSDCLNSGRYANQVQRESEAVGAMGMRSTPSFLINGVFVVGAQPFEVFQQVIEEQLQASNQGSK